LLREKTCRRKEQDTRVRNALDHSSPPSEMDYKLVNQDASNLTRVACGTAKFPSRGSKIDGRELGALG
jgi:hypothetical protein